MAICNLRCVCWMPGLVFGWPGSCFGCLNLSLGYLELYFGRLVSYSGCLDLSDLSIYIYICKSYNREWFPRGETTPDGLGRYAPPRNSQNPENGFPGGGLRQTERAGMLQPQKVSALKMDSPKGGYTRQTGQVCSTSRQ